MSRRRRRKRGDNGLLGAAFGLLALAAFAVVLQNLDKLAYIATATSVLGIAFFLVRRRLHQRWLERHTDLATILLMSPQRFESFCRDSMSRIGFKARVTQFSGDQGVDLVLDGPRGKGLAQVKRWTHAGVGRPHVQQLYGEMTHRRSDFGYFITTSYFTEEAIDWARHKPMTLIDGRSLEALASRHFGRVRVTADDILPSNVPLTEPSAVDRLSSH